MAYVFDPINNTLIDDEDKSLGNKFAVLDPDLEKVLQELNERFGPGTIQEGTQGIPQPPIKTPQAIFEFEERMKGRMAEGGRVSFGNAGPVSFEKLIKPKKYEGNRFSKKMPAGTFTMRLYEGLDADGTIPSGQMDVRMRAASEILDRAGISKRQEVNVSGQVLHGVVMLPAKAKIKTINE